MEENNKNVQTENGSSDNAFNTEKTENLSKAELKEIQREKPAPKNVSGTKEEELSAAKRRFAAEK